MTDEIVPRHRSVGADVARAAVSILICLAVGGLGGMVMTGATMDWYNSLRQPALNPPSWVFAPVWTALYIMMGVALFLVWRRGEPRMHIGAALTAFVVQLILNGLWTPVFFGAHDPRSALIIIGLLWLAILTTIVVFWRVSRAASVLMMPYILWVSFAAYLNYAIVILNS